MGTPTIRAPLIDLAAPSEPTHIVLDGPSLAVPSILVRLV
jgi:hypothetical protein